MEFLTFLFASIFVILIWYYNKYHEMHKLAMKLPGPATLPILGNALLFLGKSPSEVLKVLESSAKTYGRTVRFLVGPQPQVLLLDPKDAEAVLGSQKLIDKADDYDFFSNWLGTGLLTSTGQKWFSRRKIITPTFHFKILEQFTEIFDKQSKILVKNFKRFEGQSVDVFNFITLCALDVICETAMGVQVNAQGNAESKYVKAVKDISEIQIKRQFDVFMRSNFLYKLSPTSRREKKVLKILHDFTDSVIVARREELSRKITDNKSPTNEDDIGSKKKMALLDVLLQSTINGQPLSNMDIREEVDTFVFEGHDTTTTGIAFCMYNLAKYPEVQKKVFEEIRQVIGDDVNKPVTQSDLNNLNYLDLVIKESLRLYPPVAWFGRKFSENTEINGKIIPAGTNIGIGPYFMARDETLWENALDFRPERFDVDNLKNHPYLHVPFSAGPRNCIGQKFAVLEMKSTISKTLRNFELSVAPGYEPILSVGLILRPDNGVHLIMKKRIYH